MPSVAVTDDGKCETQGTVMCVCADGTKNGTQYCAADGSLTQCACPASGTAGTGATAGTSGGTSGTGGTNTGTTELCEALKALSNCRASQYTAKELPASVLFLVDRSGSMNCNLPPAQTSEQCEMDAAPADATLPTKWEITIDALHKVFADLLAQKTSASIGLSFFSTDAACGVDALPTVAVSPMSAAQVMSLDAALNKVQPNGATPIVGGLTLAYKHLHQDANMATGCTAPCGAHGNRYVVLITDGADSCGAPTDPTDAAACTAAGSCIELLLDKTAPQALEANIKTFVIGSPGSESARGFLSELAFVAGTSNAATCKHDVAGNQGDCHFDMTTSPGTFADDLAMALSNISGAALACEFAVPDTGTPVTPNEVNVQYSAEGKAAPICLPKDASKPCDGGANGWQFKKDASGNDDLTRVVLCGSACDTLRKDPAGRVDVIRGCQSLE
jgi:von Willebrand factor type A domain